MTSLPPIRTKTVVVAADVPPQPKRRAKALLQAYYSVQTPDAENSGNPSVALLARRKDPYDIDGLSFDSEKYLTKALQEQPLQALIARDNDLVSDIRELDGDMKTLVYENYSKFISATDTIRKMKVNVDSMETELELLKENVNKINSSATSVNDALAEKRGKIHQLSGVHNLLQRLQFIYELPQRLTQCLRQKAHAQAVRYYTRTSRLLVHYRHIIAFKNIEDESNSIMVDVSRHIKDKMRDPASKITEIAECVNLLVGLDTQSQQELYKEYIQTATAHFQKLRAKTIQNLANLNNLPSVKAPTDSLEEIQEIHNSDKMLLKNRTMFLNSSLLAEFQIFAESYDRLFLSFVTTADRRKVKGFTAKLNKDETNQAQIELSKFMDSFFQDYLSILDGFLSLPKDMTTVVPQTYLHIFDQVYTDTRSEDFNRVASMDAKLKSLMTAWLTKFMTELFDQLKFGFFAKLESTLPVSSEVIKFAEDLSAFVADTLVGRYLPILKNFLRNDIEVLNFYGLDQVIGLFQKSLDEFFVGFFAQMMVRSKNSSADRPKMQLEANFPNLNRDVKSLILSRACLDLHKSVIDIIYQAYNDQLFGVRSRRKSSQAVSMSGTLRRPPYYSRCKEVLMFSGNGENREIILLAREFCDYLIAQYIEATAGAFTQKIRDQFMTINWIEYPSPTSVSSWLEALVEEIEAIGGEIGQVYEDDGALEKRERSSRYRREPLLSNSPTRSGGDSLAGHRATMYAQFADRNSPSKYGNDLFSNIDKLFEDKIEYFGNFTMTRGGIHNVILKLFLKTFIEEIRRQTFSKFATAQILIDVEYLRMRLWRVAVEEKMLMSLTEEMIQNSTKRCTEPRDLPLMVIDEVFKKYEQVGPPQ